MAVLDIALPVLGGALAMIGTIRVIRDPRRISTGLILFAAAVLLALWVVRALHVVAPGPAVELVVLLLVLLPPLSLLAAGAGLLINGVVLTRREGLRLATAVAPLAGVGLIALPLLAFGAISDAHSPAWRTAALVTITLLGMLILVQLIAFTGYAVLYARLPQPPGADVVVVLGCGLRGEEVTPLLASRLDRAAEVFRSEQEHGGTPLLVTSGGRGPGESVAEADAMADYLEAAGIASENLVRENHSRNTEQNLRMTAEVLRGRGIDPDEIRMTVVTSDFHVLRTAALSRHLGLHAQVTGARTARYFVPSAFLREFVAVLVTHRRVNLAVGGVLVAAMAALLIVSYSSSGIDAG
ncbi:YdcF family protein [Nocardia sp. NBC_00511]|uniref:YdcF family protein n=1 Tax=Nocardia sp. NBC_00511 TaxID=2903591 RepID=UPI0030E12EBB